MTKQGEQEGLVRLRKISVAKYKLGNYGIYSNRTVRGGTKISKHAEGRAWDAKCDALNSAGLKKGNDYRDILIANHAALGIEKIIWNREVWTPDEGMCEYTGLVPHTNHLHIEMSWDRAAHNVLSLEELSNLL